MNQTEGGLKADQGGQDGNTLSSCRTPQKQAPKRKSHFFTVNNYSEEFIEKLLKAFFDLKADKYAFQEEIAPSTGTPHLQGMVVFPKEQRSTTWDPQGLGHYEKLKDDSGSYQLKAESQKPDGRQWKHGFPKPLNILKDEHLYEYQKKILDILEGEPDERTIYWFWENIGGVGKSQFTKKLIVEKNCLFCDGGKKADLINLVFNNDMDNCKGVIWDIPRSTRNHISYAALESIKNGIVCNTKYETGNKVFNSPHIIVFANFPPETDELSLDRWKVREIINKDFTL